jgi:hypothetical protein
VESYFLRANDPDRPRAVWLKATIYAPLEGPPEVESWLVVFDGARATPIAGRETAPLVAPMAPERGGSTRVIAGRLLLDLSPTGSAQGTVNTPSGGARVDLAWTTPTSPVAAPLSLLRTRVLQEGPFPRSKLLTPSPSLVFSGSVDVAGELIDVTGWRGMQGHNWGKEHAFEYAWGQCLFPAAGGSASTEPDAMLEGFSARVMVGGRLTPRVSCLVVRRGGRELRFDTLFDLWRQRATVEADRWTLEVRGGDGTARLEMDAGGRPVACLGYRNPDGHRSYCFNSKLARVRLQVQPAKGAAFECVSEHGGALEFLRRTPDPRFSDVV